MNAMQEMLRQGGQLPLNRDGAVGWVYDDSVWFVAKRLADTVRAFIVAQAGDEAGIPGENKNDRLFDCWQEYGQIMLNPQTGQAIWHVTVHGEAGGTAGAEGKSGYSHSLSMLRFPLAKLWPDPPSYPQPMAGRIEVLAKRKGDDAAPATPATGAPLAAAAPGGPEAGAEQVMKVAAADPVLPAATADAATNTIPAPRFAEGSRKKTSKPQAAELDPDDVLAEEELASAAARANKRPARSTAAAAMKDATEAAGNADSTQAPEIGHAEQEAPWSPQASASAAAAPIGRVALHNDVPTRRAAATGKEPSEAALAFMRWVQQCLGEGSIKYNEAGALVHFVESGMALVSPAIFREFATRFGEPPPAAGTAVKSGADRVGTSIQREVLRAGWHLPSPADGTNIWTFNVSRRGGTKTSKLSVVVLADAHRWVMEPPPANPTLQLPSADPSRTG
jgi:hypothetical protein